MNLKLWPLLLVVPGVLSCSHISQTKSAEKAVATAKVNADLSHAAVLMRVSDYGQEARYVNGLTPLSKERTSVYQILGLLVQLAGPGKMTEAKRQAFSQKLLAAGKDAQKAIDQATDTDAGLKRAVAEKDAQLAQAQTKLATVAEHSATVADDLDTWLHYFLYVLIIAGLYFLARILISLGVFGAKLASKFPL